MSRTVVLVGALDTKGNEFKLLKVLIEAKGLNTLVVDFGVMGQPSFELDIRREVVVAAGGGDLDKLNSGDRKDEAMQTMASGLAVVVRRLFDDGKLDGIIGMGGTGGTSVAPCALRTLPIGVPKVGCGAGTGISAKFAEMGGADLQFRTLPYGRTRVAGRHDALW